jgi:hypothetical protein
MEYGTLRRMLLALIMCACLLHLLQLFLYPLNPKWFVALIGAVLYGTAASGIHRDARFGYYLAIGVPILAGMFVAGIFALRVPERADGIQFNVFTALAALVEIPAVLLGVILMRKQKWTARLSSTSRSRS